MTANEKAKEMLKLALENYETWGHWVYECETEAELTAEFEKTGQSLDEAIDLAKMYADYAAEIKATGDW